MAYNKRKRSKNTIKRSLPLTVSTNDNVKNKNRKPSSLTYCSE